MNKVEMLKQDEKMREYIRKEPQSLLAWAYRLGRKDAIVEAQEFKYSSENK